MRFNHDANTIEDAREYFLNRSEQLLIDNIKLCGFEDTYKRIPGTYVAHFLDLNSMISYASIYILKDFRGRHFYKNVASYIGKPIITVDECNLVLSYSKEQNVINGIKDLLSSMKLKTRTIKIKKLKKCIH